jgi:phage protein D
MIKTTKKITDGMLNEVLKQACDYTGLYLQFNITNLTARGGDGSNDGRRAYELEDLRINCDNLTAKIDTLSQPITRVEMYRLLYTIVRVFMQIEKQRYEEEEQQYPKQNSKKTTESAQRMNFRMDANAKTKEAAEAKSTAKQRFRYDYYYEQ